jgi:hypothetical protein
VRTDVCFLVAPDRGSGDQIEAASAAHAGLGRAGAVQRYCLDHPDLPAVRSEQGSAVGKLILHPAGPQIAGGTSRRPTPASVALRGYPSQRATSALCLFKPEVPRPGRDAALRARGHGITAGAGRDAGGGPARCGSGRGRAFSHIGWRAHHTAVQ